MSDYSKTTNFTAKDSLSSGDPNKLVKGVDFDLEFDALVVAVATKYDTNDIASQAEAQALSSNAVLMTPGRVNDVLTENAGMLGDIQALADPNADRLLFWDDSAGAVALMTVSTGLTVSTTNITVATQLQTLNALTPSDGGFIVGDGAAFVVESTTTARTSLGVGTGDSPQFTAVNIGHASDCTLSRDGAGQIAIEGDAIFSHDSATYTSSKIFFSVSDPSGGADGDIWFKYS
jgi:hypothetical protein